MAALVGVLSAGCERKTGTLLPVPPITDPVVFGDDFGSAVDFQAFLGSNLGALSIDPSQKHSGSASLKVTVPGPGDPAGAWAGGAFTTTRRRDLSGYNALTFWARASMTATLDVAGLGNDNTGTSKYEASRTTIPLTTTWTKHVIPIPLPAKLESEGGLFFFAEGPESGMGYTIWLDEVRFETVPTIANPRPVMTTQSVETFVGSTVKIQGTATTFSVDGLDVTIEHLAGYFTFRSSNETVATVAGEVIRAVGAGNATITAKLGSVDATGEVTLNVTGAPSTAAPAPTVPAADVISLFSNAYTNVRVDTWSANWDMADVSDIRIAGDDVKAYTNLVFAGIEFTSQTVDATSMTHFHMDIWLPAGTIFKVKLVDFGANGVFGGGDDREHELTFTGTSTPPLTTGAWVGLEIPLADFTNLTTRAHLAQLILSGNAKTVFVDNVYFHR